MNTNTKDIETKNSNEAEVTTAKVVINAKKSRTPKSQTVAGATPNQSSAASPESAESAREQAGSQFVTEEINLFGLKIPVTLKGSMRPKIGPDKINKVHTQENVKTGDKTVGGYFTDRITTIEQLVEFAHIDLTKWVIDSAIINKWEGLQKGGVEVTPLYQVKIHIKPIKEEKEEPVFTFSQPAPMKFVVRTAARPEPFQGNRVLILPDPHIGFAGDIYSGKLIPFHSRAALDLAVQIAATYRFTHCVILGDWLDLPDFSTKYLRNPAETGLTQYALNEASYWLGKLSAALGPGVTKKFLTGNHEDRINKYIFELSPALAGLRAPGSDEPMYSLSTWLNMKQYGWELVPGGYLNGIYYAAKDIRFIHGERVSSKPGDTARKTLEDFPAGITAFGHIHRIELASDRMPMAGGGNQTAIAFTPGCLCRVSPDSPVPGHKPTHNWNQGLGIITFTESSQDASINTLYIDDGKTTGPDGRRFVGAPNMKEIAAVLPKLEIEE
jgi:hypothetical protein